MAGRMSRRKIATYVAERLLDKQPIATVLREAAAYLVQTNRTREADLLVRDVEDILADHGIVIADVTVAHDVSDMTAQLKQLTGAKQLHVRQIVDESVIGGVRVDVPGARYDGTIQYKLNALRAKQL